MAYTINTMDKCNQFLDKLKLNGWKCWQMQYRWNDENGFHAWFWKTGEKDIEIVTHNKDVQRAIVKF